LSASLRYAFFITASSAAPGSTLKKALLGEPSKQRAEGAAGDGQAERARRGAVEGPERGPVEGP
jgi:hypothetical protein